MDTVQIRIEGDQAEAISASLKQYIEQHWSMDVEAVPTVKQPAKDDKDLATTLGVISILIGLPGFLESNMVSKLTRRIEAKQKLLQLLEWAEQHLTQVNNVLWLEIDGQPFLLNSDRLDEMLDALQEDSA